MIYCKLKGGLGNMMFQVAAASAHAIDHDDSCAFFHQVPPRQGQPSTTYCATVFRAIDWADDSVQSDSVYSEPHFHHRSIPYRAGQCLDGYFQSERYFKRHGATIRALFRPPEAVKSAITETYGPYLEGDPIAIHVRRGDYLKLPAVHPVCGQDYYRRALAALGDSASLLVCTDDVDWCERHLRLPNARYVRDVPDWYDLYLMSFCRRFVITNSSFSWWAAWLSEADDKIVLAPSPWFGRKGPQDIQDLLPAPWQTIQRKLPRWWRR